MTNLNLIKLMFIMIKKLYKDFFSKFFFFSINIIIIVYIYIVFTFLKFCKKFQKLYTEYLNMINFIYNFLFFFLIIIINNNK